MEKFKQGEAIWWKGQEAYFVSHRKGRASALIERTDSYGWKCKDDNLPEDYQLHGEKNSFWFVELKDITRRNKEEKVDNFLGLIEVVEPSDFAFSYHSVEVEIEPVNIKPKKTIMSKITTIMKKLLDADTQALVKAGFLNSELDVTIEGQNELNAILFNTNKAALVEAANAKIADESKK